MNDRVTLAIGAVGTGKQSWNLPGGYRIASIRIDNPSGSWLKIPQDDTFIPPYTVGYVHNFPTTLASLDVLFSNGPAGQVSTRQGDTLTLEIDSSNSAENLGVTTFIQNFTPLVVGTLALSVPYTNGASGVVLAAVANKRYRIHTIDVTLGGFYAVPPPQIAYDSGIHYFFFASVTATTLLVGRLNGVTHPSFQHIFSEGLDLPVSNGLSITAVDDWANNDMFITATAELI